jgi:ABC-type transporter Mla subunit MlaD
MRLPGPSDLFRAAGDGYQAVEQAIGLLPRVVELVAGAEKLIDRAGALIARVERTAARAGRLVDSLDPTLTKLQPILQTLADTTSPVEVQAAVTAIDLLPEIVGRLSEDIMPILKTMDTVSPDLSELLLISRELNEMLGAIPGLGRAKRKFAEEREEQEQEPEKEHA